MTDADVHDDLLERAIALAELGRLADAEAMLRRALATDPDDPFVLTVLSLVLSDSDRPQEALDAAQAAVALEPDFALPHAAVARAFLGLERYDDATTAAGEALRLDPDDPERHELLGIVHYAHGKWDAAVAATERALAIDPESESALALRAAALSMSSRGGDWREASGEALAAAPLAPNVHALAGLAHLTGGGEREAVDRFREALRLDPSNEAAQAGLAQAMKAAHPLFKPFFRFFLWQERLSTGTMIGLWIGAVIAIRALWIGVGGVVGAVALGVWLAFVASTWLAEPLANLALRTSRIGRAILPADQKRSSSIFGLLVAGAVLCAALMLVNGAFVEAAFVFVFLAFAAGSLHGVSPARGRLLSRAIVTIALAALAGAVLIAAGVELVGAVLMISTFLAAVVLLWVVRLS